MGNVQYAVWAFAAGLLIPAMAALNGSLGRALGSTAWAAAVLFMVGLAAALMTVAATGPGWPNFAQARPEQFLGGLVVAFYVLSATYLTPRFGVGPTVLCVVTAQIVAASVIGHFGWLGAPRQPLDLLRAVGLLLMLGGLVLTQTHRAA